MSTYYGPSICDELWKRSLLQIDPMAEGTSYVMAKEPNIGKNTTGILRILKKKHISKVLGLFPRVEIAEKQQRCDPVSVCCTGDLHSIQPPPPHLPPREIPFCRECWCLPNHKHPTVSSQRIHADPGSDISACWHLCCPSWKLSFCLLTHVMGVAAGTTYSIPEYEAVQIRTGPGDQEEIGKSSALWTSGSSFIKWEWYLCLKRVLEHKWKTFPRFIH